MPLREPPKIEVDFNEMIEQDVVLLASNNEVLDSSGVIVRLHEGMQVLLFMPDVDDAGKPKEILASGVVEKNTASDWSSGIRWCCRIDKWDSG